MVTVVVVAARVGVDADSVVVAISTCDWEIGHNVETTDSCGAVVVV